MNPKESVNFGKYYGKFTKSDYVNKILDEYYETLELIRMGIHSSYLLENVTITTLFDKDYHPLSQYEGLQKWNTTLNKNSYSRTFGVKQ